MSRARDLADLGGSADAGGLTGRNLIINGAMTVAQRSTSATGVAGYIAVDRFRCTGGADAVDQLSLTHAQVTDVPDGFANSYKITVSTPETALAADEMIRIEHRMEGQNLQHLKKGTSSAEAVTLSFWIKGSVTGTYIVNLHDTDNTRTIAASYTINAANTWEYKTITFAGDTTGALDNDNAQSLSLYWYLGAGTNWTSGTLGTSWDAFTKANVAVGQTDILTTSGATWQITGVQFEVGSTATDFEHETYATTLRKCQRYFELLGHATNAGSADTFSLMSLPFNGATNNQWTDIPFMVEKRAAPTSIVAFNGYTVPSATVIGFSTNGMTLYHSSQMYFTRATGGSQGDAVASVSAEL